MPADKAGTNIGTELLFENDRIRVWDMVLQPGESSPYHRHEGDYVFVYVTPNRLTVYPDGREPFTADFDDNFVQYTEVGEGIQHFIRNDSDQVHRQILIELKGPSRSHGPRPPEHNGRQRPV